MRREHFLLFFALTAIITACQAPAVNSQPEPTPFSLSETITPTPLPYWVPSLTDTFQIQLTDYPPDMQVPADVIELDLFETSPSSIKYLHDQGKKVICYINVGAWEEFRPDAGEFSQDAIGKPYHGWEGEYWLDISNYTLFSDQIIRRFDLAVVKGCDAIDADNINGFQQDTGFAISRKDQIAYNLWIANLAHERELSIGMKNNYTQIDGLLDAFDFVVIEDCSAFNECDHYSPFITHGKAVFQIIRIPQRIP